MKTAYRLIVSGAALAASLIISGPAAGQAPPYDKPIIISHADLMVHLRTLTGAAPRAVSPDERRVIDDLREWALAERERADQLMVLDRRYDAASGASRQEVAKKLRATAYERRLAYGELLAILAAAEEAPLTGEGERRVAAAKAIFQENEKDRSDNFPF